MKDQKPHQGKRAEAVPDEVRSGEATRRERRSPSRIADDQASGHGAMTALARLKMLERRQGLVRKPRDD